MARCDAGMYYVLQTQGFGQVRCALHPPRHTKSIINAYLFIQPPGASPPPPYAVVAVFVARLAAVPGIATVRKCAPAPYQCATAATTLIQYCTVQYRQYPCGLQ